MSNGPLHQVGDQSSHFLWENSLPDSERPSKPPGSAKRKPLFRDSQYQVLQATDRDAPPIDSKPQSRAAGLPSKRSWGWSWEFLSLAIVVACFAAIVGLLLALQNRPVPDWPSGITVNAVLSVLVTVMKGATGIIIAECLSQLKWLWFKRERNLIDLVIWDEASRGAWGARRLLMTPRAWYLGYLGAFTFLAAFIIGPSIQQTIEIRVRQIDSPTNASVPLCNNTYYSVMGLGSASGQNKLDLPMIGAVYNGFLQTSSQSPLQPNCPSGNCTFGIYQSLGLCHECEDKSEELVFINKTSNATIDGDTCASSRDCVAQWPAGARALEPYGIINSTIDEIYNLSGPTGTLSSTNPEVYKWRAITGLGESAYQRVPQAFQCQLWFCVKTYDAVVEVGTFRERLLNSSWDGSVLDSGNFFDFQNNVTIPARPCYVDGAEIDPPADDAEGNPCLYRVYSGDAIAIGNTIDALVDGSGSKTVRNRPQFDTDVLQALYGMFNPDSLETADVGVLSDVDRAWRSMADVVTDYARGSQASCGGASAEGIQKQDQLYLHVHWVWLTPTIVVFVICLAFFVATVVQSWGEHLWKSSPLAFLVTRPWTGDREVLPEEILRLRGADLRVDTAAMEKVSRGLQMRLEPGGSRKG